MNRGFKTRINKHISDSRTGQGTCVFAKHVFNCAKNSNKSLAEPFFKINIMMVLTTPLLLEKYEKHFHNMNYDAMNRNF